MMKTKLAGTLGEHGCERIGGDCRINISVLIKLMRVCLISLIF